MVTSPKLQREDAQKDLTDIDRQIQEWIQLQDPWKMFHPDILSLLSNAGDERPQQCCVLEKTGNLKGILVYTNCTARRFISIQAFLVREDLEDNGVRNCLWNQFIQKNEVNANFSICSVEPLTTALRESYGFHIKGVSLLSFEVSKAGLLHAINEWLSDRLITAWERMTFKKISASEMEEAASYVNSIQKTSNTIQYESNESNAEAWLKRLLKMCGVIGYISRMPDGTITGFGAIYPGSGSVDLIGQLYANDDVTAMLLTQCLIDGNNNLLLRSRVRVTVPEPQAHVLELLQGIKGTRMVARIDRSFTKENTISESEIMHTYCFSGHE